MHAACRGRGNQGEEGEVEGEEKGGQDNMQSEAAACMLARTIDRLEVLKENARELGISRGAPPGFAHAVVLVLRKLVACAPPAVFRGATADTNEGVEGRDRFGCSARARWVLEVRRAVRQVLETVDIARVELDDDYVCSGGMDDEDDDDDDDDEWRDAGAPFADSPERAAVGQEDQNAERSRRGATALAQQGGGNGELASEESIVLTGAGAKAAATVAEKRSHVDAEVVMAANVDKTMKMRQRSCWLTLRECVLFLSEVSSLALADVDSWNSQGGCAGGREGCCYGLDAIDGNEGKGSGYTSRGNVSQGRVVDQAWPVMTSADFDEVGQCILKGVYVCACVLGFVRAFVCACMHARVFVWGWLARVPVCLLCVPMLACILSRARAVRDCIKVENSGLHESAQWTC